LEEKKFEDVMSNQPISSFGTTNQLSNNSPLYPTNSKEDDMIMKDSPLASNKGGSQPLTNIEVIFIF